MFCPQLSSSPPLLPRSERCAAFLQSLLLSRWKVLGLTAYTAIPAIRRQRQEDDHGLEASLESAVNSSTQSSVCLTSTSEHFHLMPTHGCFSQQRPVLAPAAARIHYLTLLPRERRLCRDTAFVHQSLAPVCELIRQHDNQIFSLPSGLVPPRTTSV